MTREEKMWKAVAQEHCDLSRRDAFVTYSALKWADNTMIERLRELKSDYERELDAKLRKYERDIQLCAKISLIEELISELEEE